VRLLDAGKVATQVAGAALVAVGWATVDIERTATDLQHPAADFGRRPADIERTSVDPERSAADLERASADLPGLAFGDPGEEPALGARALRSRVGSIDLILLEPSTEGRLAGWLARNGEGVVVLYVARSRTAIDDPGRPTALGRPGVLQVPEDRTRPFLIVLDRS
jgi:hypothetical protein